MSGIKKTMEAIDFCLKLTIVLLIVAGCQPSTKYLLKYEFEYEYYSGYRFSYPFDSLILSLDGKTFLHDTYYKDTTRFCDVNESSIEVSRNKNYIFYKCDNCRQGRQRRVKRYPLMYKDTIWVPMLFQWEGSDSEAKSALMKVDTTLTINGVLRHCYLINESSIYYLNGVKVTSNANIFVDKEFLLPIRVVMANKNDKDMRTDTTVISTKIFQVKGTFPKRPPKRDDSWPF